jgi:hypothetical protein
MQLELHQAMAPPLIHPKLQLELFPNLEFEKSHNFLCKKRVPMNMTAE